MSNRGTWRESDGEPVERADALPVWTTAAREELELVAANYGSFVTYSQLAESVQARSGIRTTAIVRGWIGPVLAAITEADTDPSVPMLTSLAVYADHTIGPGYAEAVERRTGTAAPDLELHAANERLACYIHYGATIPSDGGRPMYPPKVVTQRAKARAVPPPPRPVCPTCFLQVPSSGVCDTCRDD